MQYKPAIDKRVMPRLQEAAVAVGIPEARQWYIYGGGPASPWYLMTGTYTSNAKQIGTCARDAYHTLLGMAWAFEEILTKEKV